MDGFGPHMANMANMGMFPGMFPPGAMPGMMGMPPGMMEADFGPMSQVLAACQLPAASTSSLATLLRVPVKADLPTSSYDWSCRE